MRTLLLSLALSSTSCLALAGSPAEYFDQIQATERYSNGNIFQSGGRQIGGSMLREGNTYEISNRKRGTTDIQVFHPMKEELPDFLQATTRLEDHGLAPGVNSVPQFLADQDSLGSRREEIAGKMPMFVPGTILKEWNTMWNSIGHGETKNMWGGTLVRYANQVIYTSPSECKRGCTFSMVDSPMMVAAKIPSLRKHWEEMLAMPLNGDYQGVSDDPFAIGLRPIKAKTPWQERMQMDVRIVTPSENSQGMPLESLE